MCTAPKNGGVRTAVTCHCRLEVTFPSAFEGWITHHILFEVSDDPFCHDWLPGGMDMTTAREFLPVEPSRGGVCLCRRVRCQKWRSSHVLIHPAPTDGLRYLQLLFQEGQRPLVCTGRCKSRILKFSVRLCSFFFLVRRNKDEQSRKVFRRVLEEPFRQFVDCTWLYGVHIGGKMPRSSGSTFSCGFILTFVPACCKCAKNRHDRLNLEHRDTAAVLQE